MGTAARAKSVARPPTNREAQPASPIEACLRESLHDSYGLVTSTTIAAITQQATPLLHISASSPPIEILSSLVFVRCDRAFGLGLIHITSLERRAWPPITSQDVFAQQEGPSQGMRALLPVPAPRWVAAMLNVLLSIGHHPWR